MEWELSKENVQPLKAGRNVEVLNNALKAKVEGPARLNIFEQRRRQFLEDIENYVGEDPLVPWIRYIKWLSDAYPAGGAQSELFKLLEKCTRLFQKDERYRRDVRYLKIWVQYADCCSDPSDVFAFLDANDIGQEHALFYEAYATSLEVRRNFSKANEIYDFGLQRSAQPLGRLESMYRSFLVRMHKRTERKNREEQQAPASHHTQNDPQSRSFGLPAVYHGHVAADYTQTQRGRSGALPPPRQPSSRSRNAAFSIYVDPQYGGPPTLASQEAGGRTGQFSSWSDLGSAADKIKENAQQPGRWSDVKIGQEAHGQHGSRSDFNIFVDEDLAEVYNHKPQVNVTRNSAPSLRLRLEDVQEIRRHSPDFKVSFSQKLRASTTQGSNQNLSESSRKVSVQDEAAPKPHPETVSGYNASLLTANGTEQTFEEFRLQVWNAKNQALNTENEESTSTAIADTEMFSDSRTSAHPSLNPDADMVKQYHCPTEFEARDGNATEMFNGPPPSSSQSELHADVVNQRAGLLLPFSNEQTVDVMSSDGVPIFDCLSMEAAAAKEDVLTDCGLPQNATLPPSHRHKQAVVHLNSFPMPGDETVAIKRFADEVIGRRADPKVNSIDTVSHHGLVEQTVYTREAEADIIGMFNKPLECDNEQSKVRKSKGTNKRSIDPRTKSSGFEIFVDYDVDQKNSAHANTSEKRATAVSGKASDHPRTTGFHPFADENSGVQLLCSRGENGRVTSNPSDLNARSSGFDVYVDEDVVFQRSSNPKKRTGSPAVISNSSSQDPAHQSRGFDIFVDNEFHLDGTRNSSDFHRMSKGASGATSDPASGWSTIQLLADDDLITKGPSQRAKDDYYGTFQILDCENSALKQPLQPVRNDEANTVLSLVDNELVVDRPLQPTKIDHMLTSLMVENSLCQSIGVDDDLQELSLSSNQVDKWESAENSTKAEKKIEVSAARLQMTVNPWDERNLQDLLLRLNPAMKRYEGFLDSKDKFSGSIPLSSLRSSTCRNKILQLGSNTYRLKGCVGQGSFAQVFAVEDQDDDLSENATKLALKFQKPACPWEFYIYRQLDMRVCGGDRCYFGQVRRFHLYSDCSFMICNYEDKGTLQDVVNAYLAMGKRMDETMCMFYTIEMLRILETLHSVGIIHGDFKPDNLLIRDDSEELVDDWTPDRRGCWKAQGLSLIDWGRSIDMTLYPEGTLFIGDCKTDSFRCPEMIEHRPWSFQVDTFGLCGVVHCLLNGSYMQTEKKQLASGQYIYRPKSPYRRYWKVELWRELFETLLNGDKCPQIVPLNALRQNFENHLRDNSLGKKVKMLLAEQSIMMYKRG